MLADLMLGGGSSQERIASSQKPSVIDSTTITATTTKSKSKSSMFGDNTGIMAASNHRSVMSIHAIDRRMTKGNR